MVKHHKADTGKGKFAGPVVAVLVALVVAWLLSNQRAQQDQTPAPTESVTVVEWPSR